MTGSHAERPSPRRPALASAQLTRFFGALASVLRYRASLLQTLQDLGRFTVNEAVLSTADALLLLHKWSLIERDSELQGALQATAERLCARDLLSACGRAVSSPTPTPLTHPAAPSPPL